VRCEFQTAKISLDYFEPMQAFDFQSHTRVVFGEGSISRLGELARDLGFKRTLLVADLGLLRSGHVDEAVKPLASAGIAVFTFHDFDVNPTSAMVESGRDFGRSCEIDSLIGLGGGSSMDCAKGINFLLTNGGSMRDYWGYGKAPQPMLPMIGIPTTAGTGSEAQCYALISDSDTHVKMACGDPKASFRVALLDPLLTASQPEEVTATTGYDAIAHSVETYVTTARTPISETFSREAWRLLEANYERVLQSPRDIEARGSMQLGAYYAGVAIESSMLGATHACANPLTARYDTLHGVAIALLLPHVVRWNVAVSGTRYDELMTMIGKYRQGAHPGSSLIERLSELAKAGGLPQSLGSAGIPKNDLPVLAAEAATQWTGQYNPRPFDEAGALEVYECAY
jgi:alcohol dehydrogenase